MQFHPVFQASVTCAPVWFIHMVSPEPKSMAVLTFMMLWSALWGYVFGFLHARHQYTSQDPTCVMCNNTGLKAYDSDPDSPTEDLIVCPFCTSGDKLKRSFPRLRASCQNLMSMDVVCRCGAIETAECIDCTSVSGQTSTSRPF